MEADSPNGRSCLAPCPMLVYFSQEGRKFVGASMCQRIRRKTHEPAQASLKHIFDISWLILTLFSSLACQQAMHVVHHHVSKIVMQPCQPAG